MTEDNQTDLSKIQNPIVRRALRRRCGDGFIFNYSEGSGKSPSGGYEQRYTEEPGDYDDYDNDYILTGEHD